MGVTDFNGLCADLADLADLGDLADLVPQECGLAFAKGHSMFL